MFFFINVINVYIWKLGRGSGGFEGVCFVVLYFFCINLYGQRKVSEQNLLVYIRDVYSFDEQCGCGVCVRCLSFVVY